MKEHFLTLVDKACFTFMKIFHIAHIAVIYVTICLWFWFELGGENSTRKVV